MLEELEDSSVVTLVVVMGEVAFDILLEGGSQVSKKRGCGSNRICVPAFILSHPSMVTCGLT
jgi:hypothetical protein